MTVCFRQLTEGPPGWIAEMHWQADLYDSSDPPCPVAVAWLTVPPEASGLPPILDYILVVDEARRQGYATDLIAACRRRWPSLRLTDATTEDGAALLESLGEAGR